MKKKKEEWVDSFPAEPQGKLERGLASTLSERSLFVDLLF